MKIKIILTVIILSAVLTSNAQIALEHTYTTNNEHITTVKLSLSGIKYLLRNTISNTTTSFTLYNLNHTVFKTIQVPQITGYTAGILYVSQTLFNSDSLIEYLTEYNIFPILDKVFIYNENGNTLFQRDSAQAGAVLSWFEEDATPIVSVGDSSKLLLAIGTNVFNKIEVYSLPGQLTCHECTNGLTSGIGVPYNDQTVKEVSLPFPNPSSGEVKIKYKLPENYHKAFINIYTISRKMLKQMEIDNAFQEITLTNEDLPSGEYFYSIIVDNTVLEKNKYIVIK